MDLPAYFLPRPPLELTPRKRLAFEAQHQSTPAGGLVDYCLAYPKWQYLSYLCARHELVLHGSQDRAIGTLEPRRARDVRDFSSQRAVYATTDGIWVLYFAILDRRGFPGMTLFNSCLSLRNTGGKLSDPVYFFSISETARRHSPWCDGMVYILPRRTFRQEPAQRIGGLEVVFPHWVSAERVEPLARLAVGPQDFPFLAQVHGHDDAALGALHAADPGSFPVGALVS